MGRGTRRVVFVLPNLNAGGAERATLNLAAAAPRSRCVVVAESSSGDLAREDLASEVIFVSNRLTLPGRLKRINDLGRILRRLRPDVVVSTLSPIVCTAAATVTRAPVMHWLQAPWMRTTAAGQTGVAGGSHRFALRAISDRSRIVAGATPGLLQECLTLGVAPEKLALLPNGLRLPPFERSHRSGKKPVVVMVARLEPQKRPDLLLEAVALLAKEREIELVFVGSGACEDELKERARALRIAERVTFKGFVPDPDRYIRTADVFALATDHEGFGNVIVEALACGVPLVVSDVPYGPRFILGPTRMGRLVPPGSPTALAEGLRLALDAPPTDEDRVGGRRRAEDFTLDRVAARFETILDYAVANRHEARDEPPTSWP
jgi:glycosyltransferase involved in cell wall biosynthesis